MRVVLQAASSQPWKAHLQKQREWECGRRETLPVLAICSIPTPLKRLRTIQTLIETSRETIPGTTGYG